jgi:hypothetical protein
MQFRYVSIYAVTYAYSASGVNTSEMGSERMVAANNMTAKKVNKLVKKDRFTRDMLLLQIPCPILYTFSSGVNNTYVINSTNYFSYVLIYIHTSA